MHLVKKKINIIRHKYKTKNPLVCLRFILMRLSSCRESKLHSEQVNLLNNLSWYKLNMVIAICTPGNYVFIWG